MPTELQNFMAALTGKNWFAVAAITLMAGLQLSKYAPVTSALWKKIPQGYRWVPPVVGAAATAFVHGYVVKETFGDSAWDALKIALSAIGLHAGLTESPLPYNGGAGGTPSATAALPAPAITPAAPAAPTLTVVGGSDEEMHDRPTPTDPQPPAAA